MITTIHQPKKHRHPKIELDVSDDNDTKDAGNDINQAEPKNDPFTIEDVESSFHVPETCSQNISSGQSYFSANQISIRKEKSQLVTRNIVVESYPTYILTTKRKYRRTGRSAVYLFSDMSRKVLFEAKQKQKSPNVFDIYTPGSTDSVAALVIGDNDYSFKKYNQRGPELLTIKFQPTPRHLFRSAIVNFMFSSADKKPQRLRSRDPPLNSDDKPVFNFGNKFYIESMRNMILYSRHQDKDYIAVRKTDENELQIDTMFRANILWLVAISLSDAISPVC